MEEPFDKEQFWSAIKQFKQDYNINVGNKVCLKSCKRITILVDIAYLQAKGSLHWIDCLESEVYRCCREKQLQCDRLPMEDNNMGYTCKKKGHRDYGRKMYSNEFEEFKIKNFGFANIEKGQI